MWEPCGHRSDMEELVSNPELQYIDCVVCGIITLNKNKARDVCEEAGKEFSHLCYQLMIHEKAVYKMLLKSGTEPIPPQFEAMRAYAIRQEEIRLATLHEESGGLPTPGGLNGRITTISSFGVGEQVVITGAPVINAEMDGEVPDPPETVSSETAAVLDARSLPIDPYDEPEKELDISFKPL